MRGTGIGTSLVLIASGAVLAFAVNVQTTGINLNAIGWILILVGFIGLAISFLMLGEMGSFWGAGSRHTTYVEEPPVHHTTYVDSGPRVEETTVERRDIDVPSNTTTTRRIVR